MVKVEKSEAIDEDQQKIDGATTFEDWKIKNEDLDIKEEDLESNNSR